MLGLGNILTRGSNPVEPFTGAIVSRWPARGSGYGVTYLPDTVGTNHINTTLGQALDFDGAADGIYTDDDLMDFMHGKTAACYYCIFQQTSGTSATDGIIFAGGRTTVNMCVRQYTPGTKKLRVYTRTAAGTLIHDTPTNAYTEGHWVGMILTIDLTTGAGQFYFRDYTSGGSWASATTTRGDALGVVNTTVSLETTTNWRRFTAGAGFTNTTPAYYFDGMIYRAGIGAFTDYTKAVSLLEGGSITDSHILMTLDDGASLTTAAVSGTETCSAITAVGAPSWVNGSHEPSIPQKGFGGGNYTGGIGVAALYSFDVGDDTDPGCGISTASMDTLGDTFTFEMWIYKVADDGADGMCFVSTVDDAVAAADSRGFMLRNGMVGRTQALTDLQLELHGATAEDYTAVVTLGATGWWYCAFSLSGGTATLYAVKATGSSFESIASAAVGSLTVVDAGGDNRLTIMHRVGSVAGQTQDNCLAGTRVDDLVYHAGVALTEAQLWERFIYLKSRYL